MQWHHRVPLLNVSFNVARYRSRGKGRKSTQAVRAQGPLADQPRPRLSWAQQIPSHSPGLKFIADLGGAPEPGSCSALRASRKWLCEVG